MAQPQVGISLAAAMAGASLIIRSSAKKTGTITQEQFQQVIADSLQRNSAYDAYRASTPLEIPKDNEIDAVVDDIADTVP